MLGWVTKLIQLSAFEIIPHNHCSHYLSLRFVNRMIAKPSIILAAELPKNFPRGLSVPSMRM